MHQLDAVACELFLQELAAAQNRGNLGVKIADAAVEIDTVADVAVNITDLAVKFADLGVKITDSGGLIHAVRITDSGRQNC